jgi:RTX calcium-binding nonapeptide repeat (4 copies)
VVVAFLLLAGTGSAHGATARVVPECYHASCTDYVVYEAASGERNVLSAEVAGTALIVRDAGAAIAAGNGCVAIAGGVSCVAFDYHSAAPGLRAFLGDGDDTSTTPMGGDISGGRGDDRLTGSGSLSGGPGDDVLTGSGEFFDDDGRTPGHDVYRGIGGPDAVNVLSYRGRAKRVRVDLRPGRRSEDRISGMFSIRGGSGDDVLIGDNGPNVIDGAGGHDRLVGLGGNDSIYTGFTSRGQRGGGDAGRTGRDEVDAGPGNDEIVGGSGPARLRCGPGEDSVSAERQQVVEPDCELIGSAAWPAARLRSTLYNPAAAFLRAIAFCEDCSADRWRAKTHGSIVASTSARTQPAELRLSSVGRRLLRRHRRLTLQIERRFVLPPSTKTVVSGFTIQLQLR